MALEADSFWFRAARGDRRVRWGLMLGIPAAGGQAPGVSTDTMPAATGTQEERGLVQWKAGAHSDSTARASLRSYDFPFGMSVVRRSRWLKRVPICPVFTGFKARARGSDAAAVATDMQGMADGLSVCTKV